MPNINPNTDDKFYDLVVVGRGYSASTYLFTADLRWCKKILVIAGPDAWDKTVRGDGVVNHADYIYARDKPDSDVQPPAPSTRTALKDENAAILKQATDWLIADGVTMSADPTAGSVTKIEKKTYLLDAAITRYATPHENTNPVFTAAKDSAIDLYDVSFDKWTALPGNDWSNVGDGGTDMVKAMKVVYCGGAGPHANRYSDATGAGYMDLDTFMRRTDLTENKKVAVIGGNAGIDAAVKALDDKLQLYWLISGPQNSKPAWLSSKHYKTEDLEGQALIDAANARIANYPKADRFTLAGNGGGVEPYKFTFKSDITLNDNTEIGSTLVVDYVAYAVGQDPGATDTEAGQAAYQVKARIGPAAVLKPILDGEKLKPIYDINQRFGHSFETALGLRDKARSKFTGLEVVGAAAVAIANARGGSYVEQCFFETYGSSTRGLDSSIQSGVNLTNALSAIQNTTWNDRSVGTRAFDHFHDRGAVPSVADSMNAILLKLYQQSLTAADQLGTVKNQIEAINGFDIVAAASDRDEQIDFAHELLRKTEAFKQAILALQEAQAALDKKPNDQKLKEAIKTALATVRSARGAYWNAQETLGSIEPSANDKAEAYVKLLSEEEQEELREEGFDATKFAATVNAKIWNLVWASLEGDSFRSLVFQKGVLDAVPDQQRWLTNLLAIYQRPDATDVKSAVNFNSADRSQLATLLAVEYPSIKVTYWPSISLQIFENRKVSPWGYSKKQVEAIDAWLKGVNNGTKAVDEFPDLSAVDDG